MSVCVPSTPAQMFHMLRRQMLRDFRKPLIVMTPKSLLRQKEAGSAATELSAGGFRPVRDDDSIGAAGKVRTVVCCSGKVYYDLHEARGDDPTIALVRVELLYPWPQSAMASLRAKFAAAEFVWCQEEPANMGAWTFVRDRFDWARSATRRAAASPATGSSPKHKAEQAAVVQAALRR
jgi:2-oxoglutarate dehydrogenase E1 component